MGLLDFFKTPDINEGVSQFETVPDAVLLDVRTPAEYAQGRIPQSRNVPLQELGNIADAIPSRDTPIFIYCLSGARSAQAVSKLQAMGYTNVRNLGGINRYRGKVVR